MLFTCDFFLEKPRLDEGGRKFNVNNFMQSWFLYLGADSTHGGSVIPYIGNLPKTYSNAAAIGTITVEVEFICSKADPRVTVWTTGEWLHSFSENRRDGQGESRGKNGVLVDEWFHEGTSIFD